MKLTKNWAALLGIYSLIGILMGLVLSGGSCTCEDANNWWILIGLIVATIIWFSHQGSSQPEIKKIQKGRKKRK